MNKIITFSFILFSFITLAQAPQRISYQAIARKSNGLSLPLQTIGVEFKILQNSASGSVVYSETHSVITNSYGLFSLFIGGGTASSGSFSNINWSTGIYYVETSIDPTGGTNYVSVGAQQLLSVPYALYAETSGNTITTPTITGIGSTTVTSVGNTFTVSTPASLNYTAGNGIDITGGVISNTAIAVTPTITGIGSATVTSVGNTFTISTPASLTYTAGNGIDITGGVISNTAIAVTPTITGIGSATVTSVGNTFTISTPASLSYTAGNGIDITGGVISNTAIAVTPTITGIGSATVTSSGNTFTVSTPATTTYTNGTGISITSGSIIANTAPDQTVTLTGAGASTVTGTYPNFTINSPTVAAAITPTIIGIGSATVTSSGNTFTVNTPPKVTYTSGFGISIASGSIITNTFPDQPITLNGTGATTVTGFYPSFTINSPSVKTYTNGTGISITSGSIIANTSPNQTVTLIGAGASTVTGTYPNFTINSPTVAAAITPTITGIGAATVTSSGNTFTVNTPAAKTYTNGTGISITSGSIIANTAPDQTVTLTGAGASTVTGTYPNFTINSPAIKTYTNSTGISITSGSIIANTAPDQTVTLTGAGASTVTGTYPNFTINSPAIKTYTNSTGISITSGSIIANTAPDQTVTLTGAGASTVTGTYPNFTINSPAIKTYTNSTGISITSGSIIANTAPDQTVTLTGAGASTVTGTYPNFTINSPTVVAAITPTITGIGSSTVTSSGNTFTVNTPVITTYTNGTGISITSGSIITNIAPNQTVTLTGAGASTVTGTYPNFTINSPAVAAAITPTIVGTGIAVVSPSVGTNFTVNVSSPTYTASSGILSFGGTNTLVISPTLSLTGSTLISGATTNSVDLSTLPSVWSNTVGALYPTTLTNSVIIGTNSPIGGKFEILHKAAQNNPTIHLREESGNLNRIKFSNSTVPGKFFETASQTAATDANGAYSINYFDGTTYKPVLLVTGEKKVNINNLNTSLSSLHVMENWGTAGGGIISEGFNQSGLITISRNNQPGLGLRNAVLSGDELGRLQFSGYNGGTYSSNSSRISVFATENYTGSNLGSEMLFSTVKTGGNAVLNVLKLGGDGDVIINPNNTSNNAVLYVKGKIRLDSSLTMAAYTSAPPVSSLNEGRIYFDKASRKFFVSEDAGSYVPLFSNSPWTQGAPFVYLTNTNYHVGIGTNTPNSLLDIQNASSSTLTSSPILNVVNSNNSYSATAGMVRIQNQTGSATVLEVSNAGSGSGISVSAISGSGITATNSSSIEPAGLFNNNNSFHSLFAIKKSGSSSGNAARIENNSSSNFADALFVENLGGGAAVHAVSGPTVSGGSNTALLIENGHIDASGSGTSISSSDNVIAGFGGINDVVGTTQTSSAISVAISSTGNPINVTFNKSYKNPPVVVVTANSPIAAKFSVWVTTSTTGFTINYTNNTTTLISLPANAQLFSYHVIGTN